ncbi:hypothetical protein H0H93_014351, partial [Arthromyces matolae]
PHFDPPRYRIGPSEHGTGMFATCDIAMGDLIFAERPVLVMPRKMMILNVDPGAVSVDEIPDAQTIQMHIAQREKFLEVLVERMEEKDQEEFYELFNSHTEDGSGPILGRVRTNGFAVIFGDEKTAEPHSATFLKGSRMNHSCIPNVTHHFDHASFSLRFHAIRPIKANSELFCSYTTVSFPKSQRSLELLSYGFTCTCPACLDPNWDYRLTAIKESNNKLKVAVDDPPKALSQTLQWIKTIEGFGLESHDVYFAHLLRAGMFGNLLGRKEVGEKYMKLARKVAFASEGRTLGDDVEHFIRQYSRK